MTVVARTRAELATARDAMSGVVAVVMTMGALHEGHASLIRFARAHADGVIVTVFVNPLQFGAGEDFDRYPRTWEADLDMCTTEGAGLVFAPTRAEIYPRHGGLLPFGIRPHAGTLRDEQIDLLIGLLAGLDEPAIVVGDFNAAAGSRPHRQLLGHLRDAYREVGRGFGHTFPQPVSIHGLTLPAPLLRIDYVFFKGPLEPLTARTIHQPGSDHRAVLADFGFSCRARESASGRARRKDRAGLVRRLRLEGAVESVVGLSRTSPERENGGLPMTETRPPDAGAQRGYHALAEAERLLMQAEQDPAAARPAAVEALRALLFQWAQTPRGERVSELLAQAAETDGTLADFQLAAADLDAHGTEADAYERAKMFVDAARGRLANI